MLPMIMNKQKNAKALNSKSTLEHMLQDITFSKNKSYGEHATPLIAPKNKINIDQKGQNDFDNIARNSKIIFDISQNQYMKNQQNSLREMIKKFNKKASIESCSKQ